MRLYGSSWNEAAFLPQVAPFKTGLPESPTTLAVVGLAFLHSLRCLSAPLFERYEHRGYVACPCTVGTSFDSKSPQVAPRLRRLGIMDSVVRPQISLLGQAPLFIGRGVFFVGADPPTRPAAETTWVVNAHQAASCEPAS